VKVPDIQDRRKFKKMYETLASTSLTLQRIWSSACTRDVNCTLCIDRCSIDMLIARTFMMLSMLNMTKTMDRAMIENMSFDTPSLRVNQQVTQVVRNVKAMLGKEVQAIVGMDALTIRKSKQREVSQEWSRESWGKKLILII